MSLLLHSMLRPAPEISGGATPAGLPRSAWIEIDVARLRKNFQIIRADLPPNVDLAPVVKDNAYGHGAVTVARAAVEAGARFLAVNTLEEGEQLRAAGFSTPLLVLGERHPDELPHCVARDWRVCVGELEIARALHRLAAQGRRRVRYHLKVDTGMGRFGIRWDALPRALEELRGLTALDLEGVASHFAMSDEADKSFALLQLERFRGALRQVAEAGFVPRFQHICNSGGLLDLPAAHFNLVRPGILALGVFPSEVCRRLPGIAPVMMVKARLVSIRQLQTGDPCGYGLRYRAPGPRRIGIVPLGYGDGFPRLRGVGHVLVCGRRAPLIGSVAMDAFAVDLTDIPEARLWDEVVIQGRQDGETITAHDLARWKGSVSYDVLVGWRARLPRVEVSG